MADLITKSSDLVIPEVMADMISAKIPQKLVVSPFAKVDTTLQGSPGTEVTVPRWEFIGEAEDLAEGVEDKTVKMTTKTSKFKIKKISKTVSITDEAALSGYGDPVGTATSQLALALAGKMDTDALTALKTATLKGEITAPISYFGIADILDLFDEEVQSGKVMFVNPKQVTTLRKDPDFISQEKYGGQVMMTGEIGMICGVRIVPSKRITLADSKYECPIVKLNNDAETEDDLAALTVYLKKDTQVSKDYIQKKWLTEITAGKFYGTALTNAAKVVLATFPEAAAEAEA